MRHCLATAIALLCGISAISAAELEWIAISANGKGFVKTQSRQPFVPWGFNYDHDRGGQLLEDYWDEHWSSVESAFAEMRVLGANVVRIHLQFGRFMEQPARPRQASLDRLKDVIALAERTGLYLDVTGLGCYHKADVPDWYDKLSEPDRWAAQAAFWEAVARVCANSPAIFCYDLMNEPVVAGGNAPRDDWLGPAFGGKHFVQYVAIDRANRERPAVAREWIRGLTAAIRKHDPRHLITVGLVPWSLNRPGLTSGFVPEGIAADLDFIAVHLYPTKNKVDEAIETLRGFAAADKPVIIEETFPLQCSAEELGQFFKQSREHATGWIGFYWGKSPAELKSDSSLAATLTVSWLELFQQMTPEMLNSANPQRLNVVCEGTYRHHLQGVCIAGNAIFWSFTTTLVKTDLQGKVLSKIPVANHHGDLCHADGKVYVAVNLGKFNDPQGHADSWVYAYDAATLKELARHATPEAFHGAGGIGFRNGHFFVVGGLPDGVAENYVYEYDGQFRFLKKHSIASGHTHLGIQAATWAHDRWWFGCYGKPSILLVTDANFQMLGRYEFDCSLGIEALPEGQLLSASGRCVADEGCTGGVRIASPDDRTGLKYVADDTKAAP